MDAELAAASVLFERPNIWDVQTSRVQQVSLRAESSSAVEHTLGRVAFDDRYIKGANPEHALRVRVYTPTKTDGKVPGVLFFHGGAFVMGDLESEHARCLRYSADAGCVVVSVDYRLAPEFPFPAGADDSYASLLWAVQNANELNVDNRRIAVAGCSAGGALAAATALMARDRGGPAIALQMLIYPVIDDRMTSRSMSKFKETPVWDAPNTEAMWAQYLSGPSPTSQYAAPGRATDLSGLPQACILTAEHDPLRDDANAYAQRLSDAGVSVELHQMAGTYHGFDTVVPDAEISRHALDEQVFWLTHHLRP